MQVPLEIAFRDNTKSDSVETVIREKVAKLHKICGYMTSCHVVVAKPQEHQSTGNPYRVRVDIRVPPGHELVIKREPGEGEMHEPLESVVRDVFDSAWRSLKELTEKQRGDVKKHSEQEATAIVEEIVRDEHHGFLRSIDGRRIYFHANSLLNVDFDNLRLGASVHFDSEMGDDGPQATSVHVISNVTPDNL
jgi:cold shock CspA family protein/ribosome-associated translation inhibitor RaiA